MMGGKGNKGRFTRGGFVRGGGGWSEVVCKLMVWMGVAEVLGPEDYF